MIFYISVILHFVLLIFLFFSIYHSLIYAHQNNVWRQGINDLYGRINILSGSREEIERQIRALYGSVGRHSYTSHVSDNLRYSGISRRFGKLTPELYIVGQFTIQAVIFGVGLAAGRWFTGLVTAMAVAVGAEYVFTRLRDDRYRKVESELLTFINSVDNYSTETDDIITILEKACQMLEGPLGKEIMSEVSAVRGGGHTAAVLQRLEEQVEHPFFKTFIRNLEISSRNSANYKEIVDECRMLLSEQQKNSRKLENIYRNARIRIGCITAASGACLYIMAELLLGMSLKDMVVKLSKSVTGSALLAAMGASLAFGAYYALIKAERRC